MMIIADAFEKQKAKETKRRARVVVLGEFSAGKSTLINLLTAGKTLRTQVTATQMPAVWMSYGSAAPYRVDLQGNEHSVDLEDRSAISVKDTAYVRMFMKTPALELCDFIDTPGNSDPNIAASAWERVAEISDVAVWCSPCTQAWRQSELAAWRDVPERVREKSILLLTRADKLTTNEDKQKVLKRVTREAGDLFSKIHMVSLLKFADVENFLRDLIGLCRQVDAASMPVGASGMNTISSLQAGEDPHGEGALDLETPVASQELENLADEVDEDLSAAEPLSDEDAAALQAMPQPGYATALWHELTENIAADDPSALSSAFQEFLQRLDHDLHALGHVNAVKAVG